MILNTPIIAGWEAIKLRRHKMIYKNNQIENKYLKPHIYRIGYKVLVRNKKVNKYEEPYIGPYPITQLWTNVNVTIRQGAVQERINISLLTFGLWGYSFYVTQGYYINLFSYNVVFLSLFFISAREHICTYCKNGLQQYPKTKY